MQIAAIGSNISYNGLKSSEDSEIAALEKTKSRLQEQIEKIKESKLDAKSKQERIKVLQDRIQQTDSTIQQKKLDKMRQKEVTSSASSQDTAPNTYEQASDRTLIQISSSYEQMRAMNSVKNTLEGEAHVLAGEIALDRSRGGSTAAVDKKSEKLEDLKEKQQDLNQKIGENNSEMNEKINDLASENNHHQNADNEEASVEAGQNGTKSQNIATADQQLNKANIKPINLYV
ncbi:MAG: hypothetical protein ABFD04_04140 [Syntrophomonas sp.]